MPVDSGNDLFIYKLPEFPTSEYHIMRPYQAQDEKELIKVSTKAFVQQCCPDSEFHPLPDSILELIADSTVGPFTALCPEMCIVAHEISTNAIVGYAAVATDVNVFMRNMEICWVPAMQEKYTQSLMENGHDKFTPSDKLNNLLKDLLKEWHNYNYECPVEVSSSYPAVINLAVLSNTSARDYGIEKRLLTIVLAALRSMGCFGLHVRLNSKEMTQHYARMGFTEIYRDSITQTVYLGRRF